MRMPTSRYSRGSIEDDCLVLVDEHTIFEMKADGFVADRIAAHGVVGLSVAPPATAG